MNRMRQAAWPVRGIMADPARLIEKHAFYFDLLEMMAEWGLNTLWWHFVDDQGFQLVLDSHPELATPHAFTKREMARLLAKAESLGIDIVPEVEALGHGRYITRLSQYAELADGSAYGFNAVCPSHPKTLPLLREIIEEVAAVFPSRYFHAGLDEVDLGECRRCARRGKGKPKWWVYAEHAKAIHKIVRAAGKEMILWADHVERDPAMLKVLPKDIIMAHWHYREIRPEAIDRSLKAGFRVIGCPALCHHGDMIMPNAANFANMDAMTGKIASAAGGQTAWAGHDYTPAVANPALPGGAINPPPPGEASSPRRKAGVDQQVLGIVNTWWTIWRGLRDAYLPAVAYTGEMLSAQSAVDKKVFARRLASKLFGLRSAAAARAIWTLHEEMIDRNQTAAGLYSSVAHLPETLALGAAWESNPSLSGGAVNTSLPGSANGPRRKTGVGARHDKLAAAVDALSAAGAKVTRNRAAFDALVLAGRIACLCLRRAQLMHQASEHYRRAARGHDAEHRPDDVTEWLGKALAVLTQIRDETRPLARAAAKEWDRTRYRDDPKKGIRDVKGTPGRDTVRPEEPNPYIWDSLVAMMDRAARFDARLVADLKRAIKKYPKTRRFPGGI